MKKLNKKLNLNKREIVQVNASSKLRKRKRSRKLSI